MIQEQPQRNDSILRHASSSAFVSITVCPMKVDTKSEKWAKASAKVSEQISFGNIIPLILVRALWNLWSNQMHAINDMRLVIICTIMYNLME